MNIRILIILIFFAINTINSNAQYKTYDFRCEPGSFCYALQITNKAKNIDSTILTPFFNKAGLFIIKNGVYNFIINRKKFLNFRVNQITKDSVYISYAFDSTKVIAFSPSQEIILKFYSLNDGRVGWPHEIISSKIYLFKIVRETKYCSLKSEKICLDSECKNEVISYYQYMTSGYGWKPLYVDNGYGYMLDNNIRHLIYNKK